MDPSKEILNRLANIKETQQYLPDEIDFILSCMESEEDYIRAAAVLASEGALYHVDIVDQLFYGFETEQNNSVKKSLIIQIGNFISACYMEGFEEDSDTSAFSERMDDFKDVEEQQLKERYIQAKELFFQYLNEYDEYDAFYFIVLNALTVFADNTLIKSKINDLWMIDDEERCLQLFPIIEQSPESYEILILDILTESRHTKLISSALRVISKLPGEQSAKVVADFLENEEPELVARALIALAEMNITPDLHKILQAYCLHNDPHIQNNAKRALDIYSAKNFSKFMSDYYGEEL